MQSGERSTRDENHIEQLPVEMILKIAANLRPKEVNSFFASSKFAQESSSTALHFEAHTYWRNQLQLHFPAAYRKLVKQKAGDQHTNAWKDEFLKAYTAEYKDLSPEDMALLSIFKQGDLQNFIEKQYTLNDLTKIIKDTYAIVWLNINRHQAILDYIYHNLVISYYKLSEDTLDLERRDGKGRTILHWAVFCHQSQDALCALIASGLPIGSAPNSVASPLHIAAELGHLEVVRYLLENGANANAAKTNGVTPLYMAAQEGHLEVVRCLLENGANANAARAGGRTPLAVAALEGHLEVVRCLLENGANANAVSTDGATPLYMAAQNGHYEVVRYLLENGANANAAKTNGVTPLYVAAQNGHYEVVRYLLENGANANAARADGATPLYIAAQKGHFEVVRYLLENGANANAAKTNGATPLYIASQEGHLEVVRYLLENDANVNAASINGVTPLSVAKKNGHTQIVKELAKAQLKQYILERCADTAPEYITSFTLFGHKFSLGLPKQEKMPAAIALKAFSEGADVAILNGHERALNDSRLGEMAAIICSH